MQRNNPSLTRPFLWLWLAAGLVILPSTFPHAYGAATDDLKQLEKNIKTSQERARDLKEQADALADEAASLRAQLILVAQSVQAREANVTRIETAMKELAEDEESARVDMEKKYAQSVDTLLALQRLALNPPEALIAQPQHPSDMVRSAILLRAILPKIKDRADELRAELLHYEKKRTALLTERVKFRRANTSLDDEQRRLQSLIAEKKKLSTKLAQISKTEQARANTLSKKARDLRDLLSRLEKQKQEDAQKRAREEEARLKQEQNALKVTPDAKPKPPVKRLSPGVKITKAKGKLTYPAAGDIVMRYGEKEKLGGTHKGISIETRRNAQIVASYDGEVAFAGPFRGYRQLLIIDHGEGYHSLITGMDTIDVNVGQSLLAGEPVANMSSKSNGNRTLYFEMRKNGAPINPSPWLGRRNGKAQG